MCSQQIGCTSFTKFKGKAFLWHKLPIYFNFGHFLEKAPAETILGLVKNLKIKFNLQIQYLCWNNAGENQAFKKTCKEEGLGINFEYTAPGMPQQNGHIKCKFATLFNQVCTMLNGEKFTTYLQSSVWAEAANTATVLKNHLITPNRTLSPFQQFLRKERRMSYLNAKIWWNVHRCLQGKLSLHLISQLWSSGHSGQLC